MMDILDKLYFLEMYYHTHRAVGHTEAMIRGVENVDKVAVLFPTHRQANTLLGKRNTKAKLFSFLMIDDLRGVNLPLILDHTVTELLCSEAGQEIKKLRRKIRALKES